MNGWIHMYYMIHIYIHTYIICIKWTIEKPNKTLPFVTTWRYLEGIMLCKISQRKTNYFTWSLKQRKKWKRTHSAACKKKKKKSNNKFGQAEGNMNSWWISELPPVITPRSTSKYFAIQNSIFLLSKLRLSPWHGNYNTQPLRTISAP